jgi:S-disulfanyl-L-cysteine oxidoreductase SoxD
MPAGRGLPAGEGSVSRGEEIYQSACAHCHGSTGQGGAGGALAGAPLYSPAELAADLSLLRTVGNYWPYATSLFDYIRRAMPFDRPGSLTDDEVYAVTAYLLYLNGLVERSGVVDGETLSRVEMPARRYFKPASQMER